MRDDTLDCSIQRTLDIIGDRWTLLILRDLFRGVRRFSKIQADLGIAKNLLADRLSALVEAEIVEKVAYQERPLRHEYRLTAKGRALSPALVALMRWGDIWCSGGLAPTELIHDRCGTRVAPALVHDLQRAGRPLGDRFPPRTGAKPGGRRCLTSPPLPGPNFSP